MHTTSPLQSLTYFPIFPNSRVDIHTLHMKLCLLAGSFNSHDWDMGSFFHTILKFVYFITCSEKLKSSILCYNKLKTYSTYYLLGRLKRITAINVNPFLTKIDFHVAKNTKILTFSWHWHSFSWLLSKPLFVLTSGPQNPDFSRLFLTAWTLLITFD